MKINPYLNLTIIVLFITFLSFVVEIFYPGINDLKKSNLIGLFFFEIYSFLYFFIFFIIFIFI